jgi:hypothetical protein
MLPHALLPLPLRAESLSAFAPMDRVPGCLNLDIYWSCVLILSFPPSFSFSKRALHFIIECFAYFRRRARAPQMTVRLPDRRAPNSTRGGSELVTD